MEKKEAMKILKDFHDKSALFSVRTALETLHPELKESEDERMVNQLHSWMNEFGGAEEYTEKVYQWLKGLIEKQGTSYTKKDIDNAYLEGMAFAKDELEKQGEKKSSDEVLKIRQELYQSGYNDGYKHGCEDTKKQGEQKPTDEDMKEALRTEYEKGRADAFAQMQKEWSEEDECTLNGILDDYKSMCKTYRNWLESIKNRIQQQQKQEWSEEDEKMCNDTIQFIEKGWTDNGKSHLIPWLKSLKERYFLEAE